VNLPLFWKLKCESDQTEYGFDWEGSVSLWSELLLCMGMIKFLADSQTLSPIFHGVYFTP
jgi:hypothetical protein